MGSARPRSSTRAGKARSVKSVPKSRRNPPHQSRHLAGDTRAELTDIRRRLEVVMACSACVGAALRAQHADFDEDAALVLQRSVVDELDRLIERIDALLAGGAS